MTSQLFVSIVTPAGRAAVATVLVWGPSATAAMGQLFRSRHQGGVWPLDRIIVGRWIGQQQLAGEQVVVARRDTATFEVHCHGGRAAVQAIVDSLQQAGGKVVEWQDSPVVREGSAIQQEALQALAGATTELAARHLLAQYEGSLATQLDDFERSLPSADRVELRRQLDQLLATASVGLHLVVPFQIAICGPPNAGKSSLTNALAGYERSIVYDQPGTTRDALTVEAAIEGWPVRLVDTAGLRETDEALEAAGIQQALTVASQAELVLLVLDQSQTWQLSLQQWLDRFPTALVVRNKCDLPAAMGDRQPPGLVTSAVNGTGLPQLLQAIGQRLLGSAPAVGSPLVFSQRQVELLEQARDSLAEGRLKHVARLLKSLR